MFSERIGNRLRRQQGPKIGLEPKYGTSIQNQLWKMGGFRDAVTENGEIKSECETKDWFSLKLQKY